MARAIPLHVIIEKRAVRLLSLNSVWQQARWSQTPPIEHALHTPPQLLRLHASFQKKGFSSSIKKSLEAGLLPLT